MSGRGRGNKSRKRDLIDAPKITSAPAKIANKGNLPKKLKADVKKSSRSTRTPTPPPVVHEEGDEEEEDFSWKCHLLEFIQQYPEVFDKASPRYKKKNLREAAWEDKATAMDSDGI